MDCLTDGRRVAEGVIRAASTWWNRQARNQFVYEPNEGLMAAAADGRQVPGARRPGAWSRCSARRSGSRESPIGARGSPGLFSTPRAPTCADIISRVGSENLLRDVVAPEIGGAEVAEGDLGGFVAGLAHQLGEAGAGVAGGGGEAGAQAVPGVALRVEPGVARGLLDQAGDRLVGQRGAGDPAGLGDGAEQRALGAHGRGGGPVEIRRGAAMREPGLQRGERADAGFVRVGPDGDVVSLAVLVGLASGAPAV